MMNNLVVVYGYQNNRVFMLYTRIIGVRDHKLIYLTDF
jgi:hypothetical protein